MPLCLQRPACAFALFAGLLGFAVAGFAPQLFNDGDTWWHLAAGGWMLDHRAVLTHDPFTFTYLGQPWFTQEWLSEMLMAGAFRLDGWAGLHLLFGLAMAVASALVAAAVRARAEALPALLISVIGLACILGSLLARPHLLALAPLALWTIGLLRARGQGRAPHPGLWAVMLLWANLHGSFAFGLALAAAFAVEAAMDDPRAIKGWLLFLAGAVVAALITPHGMDGLLFPFRLLLLGSIHAIGEWAPTDLTHPGPFVIALVVLVLAIATGRLKLKPIRALILLGLCYLALAHVRHQMLFGVVAPLLVAASLPKPSSDTPVPRWLMPLGAGLFALLVVVCSLLPVRRGDDRVSPMTALAHVPGSLRTQRVLNGYDFGGYLIFSGVPVFVDGRTDMYADAFLADYDQAMKPDAVALAQTLARWHIAWTILPPGPPATAMDALPGWHRLYSDGFAVVHSR